MGTNTDAVPMPSDELWAAMRGAAEAAGHNAGSPCGASARQKAGYQVFMPGQFEDQPSAARIDDYLLGGTHHLPVDRDLAEQMV